MARGQITVKASAACNACTRFKLPKGVAFIDEIPRNPTGKPLKRLLRVQFPGPAQE